MFPIIKKTASTGLIITPIIFCPLPTEMDFDGDCVTLNHSQTSLQSLDFMKKARSAKIEGTCPWIVCTKVNFKGHRVRLNPNTDYEILPHDLHRKIASLRVANPNMDNLQDIDQKDVTNTLDRLWAYLKIRNSLKPQSTSSEIQTASEAALEKGFLTPYTNFQWINQQNKSQSITFEDLNPVFFQGKKHALKK